MKENKISIFGNDKYIKIVKWVFPIILVVFSYIRITRGVDYTDTGYNLGNYTYLDRLDRMWFWSTLFSNYIGWGVVRLPGGSTLLGANVYFGIIKTGFVLFSYFFFTKKMKFHREVVFIAEVISLGLWWLPNAGLYHYLSSVLFAVGAVLVYEGLVLEREMYFIFAGVVLALNVFVRFPNLVQAGLIVVAWGWAVLTKQTFKKCMRITGKCIAGYVGTLAIVFGIIAATGNFMQYVDAIKSLFAMTGDAKKYGSVFMLVNLFNSYTCVWYYMIPIVLGAVVLMVVAFIPDKFRVFGYIASVCGYIVVYVWEYTRPDKLFDYNFRSYSSIYLYMVVILCIIVGLLVLGLFVRSFSKELRIWCLIALVIQMITPIGSNNSLYAVMTNLFFILPVALMVLTEIGGIKIFRFVHSGLWVFMLLFMAQCIAFGSTYAFRDGFLSPVSVKVNGIRTLEGMRTEAINAEFLERVEKVWEQYDLSHYQIITFGELPGFAYIYESMPAISSTWPTLDSYSAEKFEKELDFQSVLIKEKGYRIVVCTDRQIQNEGIKQDILKNFLQENNFTVIYDEDNLFIWIQEEYK